MDFTDSKIFLSSAIISADDKWLSHGPDGGSIDGGIKCKPGIGKGRTVPLFSPMRFLAAGTALFRNVLHGPPPYKNICG